ncbi:MAG: LamG domain-containing protein [Candidatus Marsarchaeota archaeon]|nr:LamG domain-containing protein [Candidatus Marsarchaeota archaeon]
MRLGSDARRGQIALEFLIVYSFVLVIFLVVFFMITTQRAATLDSQEYSSMQLVAQNIAAYLDQAVYAGSGYNATIPLVGGLGTNIYNITISSSGVVIANTVVGSQVVSAIAFSSAKNIVINGTKVFSPGNEPLYKIPTYTGYLRIANEKGVIFVDEVPPSTAGLASYMSVQNVAQVQAAYFNGTSPINSIAMVNGVSPLNNLQSFTIFAYVYPKSYPLATTFEDIYAEGKPSVTLDFFINSAGNLCLETENINNIGVDTVCSNGQVPLNRWSWVATNLFPSSGEEAALYINGIAEIGTGQYGASQTENEPSTYIAIGGNPGVAGGQNAQSFNGFITNLQIYNASLQLSGGPGCYLCIMSRSIASTPNPQANVLEWFPLNGNTRDYSGNGHSVIAYNVIYQTVAQLNATLLGGNGAPPATGFGQGLPSIQTSTLVGLFGSGTSTVTANQNYNPESQMCMGNETAYLISNAMEGVINVTATAFNGNQTLLQSCGTTTVPMSTLVGWWPLNQGFGNTIVPDFSGEGSTLTFNGFAYGYPKWVIANRNASNVQPAAFPGNPQNLVNTYGQDGWISISGVSSSTTISKNDSFTTIAWIYPAGLSTTHPQGIIGDLDSANNGFQMSANSLNLVTFDVNGKTIASSPNSITPQGRYWLMVSGTYDGATGESNIYLNGTLVKSANIGNNLVITTTNSLLIAYDHLATQLDVFNGMIMNAQVYGSALNKSQINNIYMEGATGIPLNNVGLVGWWPLNGNPNDYSNNGNDGTDEYTVTFNNVAYSSYNVQNPEYGLQFNPKSLYPLVSASTVTLISGNTITATAWINPSPKQAHVYINGVLFYGDSPLSTCSSGTSPSFSFGVQDDGFPYLATHCQDFTPGYGERVNYNSWNFLAAEINGTTGSLFLNGQWMNTTFNKNVVINVHNGPAVIGSADDPGLGPNMRMFNGTITDVQLYNSVLTTQQLTQLYEQGFPPTQRLNITSN